MGELTFRGLKNRTMDDQMRALEAGYNSTIEYAIDELGRMLLELDQRLQQVEALVHGTQVDARS